MWISKIKLLKIWKQYACRSHFDKTTKLYHSFSTSSILFTNHENYSQNSIPTWNAHKHGLPYLGHTQF